MSGGSLGWVRRESGDGSKSLWILILALLSFFSLCRVWIEFFEVSFVLCFFYELPQIFRFSQNVNTQIYTLYAFGKIST